MGEVWCVDIGGFGRDMDLDSGMSSRKEGLITSLILGWVVTIHRPLDYNPIHPFTSVPLYSPPLSPIPNLLVVSYSFLMDVADI
jgi:hypothetical protein